jgi:Na+-transporting NADH:ubiquinone oxidoreductase subunit NqrB
MSGSLRAPGLPLWPLPLLAALLPLVAAVLALRMSAQAGLVPDCNPLIEGCTSISRAARQGDATPWFRALTMPGAVLQALVWLAAARWLGKPVLAVLGVAAGVALLLYTSFLGIEGTVYRALRQYGTVGYFGFSCIGIVIVAGGLRGSAGRAMRALAATVLLLGLANALLAPLASPALEDRIQNATEWWGALLLVVAFLLLAGCWRALRVDFLAAPLPTATPAQNTPARQPPEEPR